MDASISLALRDPSIERDGLAWAALKTVDAAVSVVDVRAPGQPLVFVNDAFCRLTGYAEAEVLGRNCRLLQHPDIDPASLAALRHGIDHGRPVCAVLRNRRRDGSAFWNALQLMPIADADGDISHFVGYQRDVSDWNLSAHTLLALDERGQDQARQRFDIAVADALREQASGRQRHVVIVLRGPGPALVAGGKGARLPIDRASITVRLRAFMTPTAALCFPDGGCVALLVPVHDDETPCTVGQHVLDAARAVWACHAGLAEPIVDGEDAAALLRVARGTSQQAAALLASDPRYADPARDARDRRSRQLIGDVAAALPGGQFRLVYQPMVDLASGQMCGLEALLRWRHPTLGEVMPCEFIAQLERRPEIHAVTHWIVATALAQLAAWDSGFGRPLRMSINVPAELLLDDSFVVFALAELERHQLSPRQLEIELTERTLARADGPAVSRLRELRKRGVLVAIDDFGTGWSSLSYLAQLPVDTLKLDMQFTRGVTRNRADAAISRMAIELAHGLGLRCVAEGIERPGQLRYFAGLRCHEGQGYLFARPLEAAAVDALVAAPARFGGFESIEAADTARERHLLILDDEENVLRAIRRTLRPAGLQIHITTSHEEAFEVLACFPVGVVLADQRMPGMTGSEFLRRVKDLYPQTRRIVLSGYTDLQSITDSINQGAIYKFLTKPWNDAELLALLDTAFAEFELGAENTRLQAQLQLANRKLAQTLEAQGQRLSHGETALAAMHAAISSVSVPVLGLDLVGDLVMINAAAERVFAPDVPMLGEPIGHLLGFEPALEAGAPPRLLRLGERHYTVHCTPMNTGTRALGLVLTLLEDRP